MTEELELNWDNISRITMRHEFSEAANSGGKEHILTGDCWCRPDIDWTTNSIVHRPDRAGRQSNA